MKAILFAVLAGALAPASPARAQTFDHVSIDIEGRTVSTRGGEQPNVGMSSGPIVIGKPTTAVLTHRSDMCGLSISGAAAIERNNADGWAVAVEILPISVEGDAVTLRVQWKGQRRREKSLFGSAGTWELTLRPGESAPLDIMRLSRDTMAHEECGMLALVLHVRVVHWPKAQHERRLLATDLWLVERLPDGRERSQPLQVRGTVNQPVPFHFDTLTDGGVSLDLFGDLTAAIEADAMVVKLEVRSRVIQDGRTSLELPIGDNRFRSRAVTETLRLSVDDVVAVELPRLAENEAGAFAERQYSIRIRTRQIR